MRADRGGDGSGRGSWGRRRALRGVALALCASGAGAVAAAAQLRSASALTAGLAGGGSALLRGAGAVGENPALLGFTGPGGLSLVLPGIGGEAGLDPVSLGDLADFEGKVVPRGVKEAWLGEVERSRGEAGDAVAQISVAAARGRFGIQVSSQGFVAASLSPEATELLLFGNAGRTGEPVDLSFDGSRIDAFATTTLAVAYGLPLSDMVHRRDEELTLGVTAKLVVGNALLAGRDAGGGTSEDPPAVEIRFPVVQTDTAARDLNNGAGFALDVGVAWRRGRWVVVGALHNLVDTFGWERDALFYRPGSALFADEESDTDFDARPVAGGGVPDEVRAILDEVDDLAHPGRATLGASLQVTEVTHLTADLRHRFGRGLVRGPATEAGIGIETYILPSLPIRAGYARLDRGYRLGFGAGLALGAFRLQGAYAIRRGGSGEAETVELTLGWGSW